MSNLFQASAIVNTRQPHSRHYFERVPPNNNTHLVSIEIQNKHRCGGSIVSSSYILTSAECVYDYQNRTDILIIRSNTTTKESGGIEHIVDDIIVHEDFKYTDHAVPVQDIAVIKVKQPFDTEILQPIKILHRESQLLLNTMGRVSGFGFTENGLNSELNEVAVPLIDSENCNDIYEEFGGLQDGQMCAGYFRGGKGFCRGDEGGSLVVNGWLTGIASWRMGCGTATWPDIYTSVVSYWDWINRHVVF